MEIQFKELVQQPSEEFRGIVNFYNPDEEFGNPGIWITRGYVAVWYYRQFVTNNRKNDLCPEFMKQIKTGSLVTIKIRISDAAEIELDGVSCTIPFNNQYPIKAYSNVQVKVCDRVVINKLYFRNL